MCQIALHGFPPVVSASAWEFRRFGPFDLRIEWLYGRVDVSSALFFLSHLKCESGRVPPSS